MRPTRAELGSSNESLPDATGCATAFLRKLKARCRAIPQRVRTFAKKTEAFAKRAHVKRTRERQNEKREEINLAHSEKVVEVVEASINVHPTVGPLKNAVHQVSEAYVNVRPATHPHESMAENVPGKVGADNVMEMRGSMDVEKHTPAAHPECCEEEIRRDADAQSSTELGEDFDTATTLGEHWDVSSEEGQGFADPSVLQVETWTTSYYEVTGFYDDDFTAEDVEEILDYMPKDRKNSLWVKTDLLASFQEVCGQWGDRYNPEMKNQEAKAQDFGGSPGESGISDNRESYSAYGRSPSIERDGTAFATEGGAVKKKTSEDAERTEHLEISFLGDSDVDNNSTVLVNDSRGAHAPERTRIVENEVSVLHVLCAGEGHFVDHEEISDTFWRGMRLVVVAVGSVLLISRWLYVYEFRIFY